MSLIHPHIAQPTLIGIKSSVVRKIEIVVVCNYLFDPDFVERFVERHVISERDVRTDT